MEPKSAEEVKEIIARIRQMGDYSSDLDLWEKIYESLPNELKTEISGLLEKELDELQQVE